MGILEKLFGSSSERELKRIKPIVNQVLGYEEEYAKLSDIALQAKTQEFKDRYLKGETLDDLLPESFAVMREASWRVLGMKHFPVQVEGGIVLHQGRIAEMHTGEGKTVVATLPVYLNALTGKGVYVVTVNDYLAKRDSLWMGKVYSFLGLSTGLIVHSLNNEERRKAYNSDIIYGTNNEIGFDYLRDNMVYKLEDRVQRPFYFGIVDEVDSILIDEARTPLIISGFNGETDEGYRKADEFVKGLKGKKVVEIDNGTKLEQATAQLQGKNIEEQYAEYDYVIEEKKKTVMLTEQGVAKAEKFYNIENLADSDNIEINHYITRSLKAYGIFKRDVDYVLKDGKVVIVDESTGRLMDGRRYSEGIHQAIEAKEKVDIQQESKTLASITFQNLFRKFEKLSGMTGTAKTEEEEFRGIYNLDVIEIPTNKPIQRVDKPDKVYITRKAKLDAILKTVEERHKEGQPILIGSVSVEKSEELSKLLKDKGVPHTVLNAKYHEKEAQIIAQAGQYGAVTIATNMAGRGTDIILGGNPEYLALEELRAEGYSEELINEATGHSLTEDVEILNIRKVYKEKETRIKKELEPEIEKVKAAGGLYILGSERHESRRIDNQLRGRAGRQGDVGVSEFILSLEDDLMRIFGTNKLVDVCRTMKIPDNIPIDMGILSNNIEKAQRRIESQYFAIRKQTLEYDEVLAKQRDIVYDERLKLLENNLDYKTIIIKMMNEYIDGLLDKSVSNPKKITEDELGIIKDNLEDYKNVLVLPDYSEDALLDLKLDDIKENVKSQIKSNFEMLCKTSNLNFVNDFSKKLLLFLLDTYWQDFMINIDELKKGIGLKAYGQTDPLQAFKFESFEMFDEMMTSIREEVLKTFMSLYATEVKDKLVKTE